MELEWLWNWAQSILQGPYGYWALFILMGLETAMILHGVPCELLMTFGGAYMARTPGELLAVIFVGTAGAVAGSMVLYWIALYGGRPFILKHRKFFRMSPERLDRLEVTFKKPRGAWMVFLCRLVPFLRGFVSIPAGLAKMNVWLFLFLSTVGALVFNFVLAYTAYAAAKVPTSLAARVLGGAGATFSQNWIFFTLLAIAALGASYFAWKKRNSLAHHYGRHMPAGWEGAVVASVLAGLVVVGALLLLPAILRAIAHSASNRAGESGLAVVEVWLIPVLGLLTIAILAAFLAAARHKAADVLAWVVRGGRRESRPSHAASAEAPEGDREGPPGPGLP